MRWTAPLLVMAVAAIRRMLRRPAVSRLAHAAAARPARPASLPLEIEELHAAACAGGEGSYVDPATGFTVFTELSHRRRGACCGSRCRHCPYGWANVGVPREQRPVRSEPLRPAMAAPRKKSVPYTKTGDRGTSALFTGERRPKDDLVFEALGAVDELNAFVGLAHGALPESVLSEPAGAELASQLENVMSRLLDVGSHVATPRGGGGSGAQLALTQFGEHNVELLELWIDNITDRLPELANFLLPGGDASAARLHVARTVCRRAERRVVALRGSNPDWEWDEAVSRYLNRLSDYLFCAARLVMELQGKPEQCYSRSSGELQRSVKPIKDM